MTQYIGKELIMKHKMHLVDTPYKLIESGEKTIELRVNDEKRRLIKPGDSIIFINRSTSETLETKVENVYKFDSFKELYKNFDKKCMGYLEGEDANPEDMEQHYSKEEQEKYGVVAIEISVKGKV